MHVSGRSRMSEFQVDSMKGQTLERIQTAAIVLVADDRMTAFREMNANLVLAAGLEPDRHNRRFRSPFQNLNVCDRRLTCVSRLGGIDAKRPTRLLEVGPSVGWRAYDALASPSNRAATAWSFGW